MMLLETISAVFRNRKDSLAVGAVIMISINGLSAIIYGVSSIVIAQALGPEQAGLLSWFIAGTAAIALFADVLGLYYASAYVLARENHDFDAPTIRATVLWYGALVGLIAGLAAGGIRPIRVTLFQNFEDSMWPLLIVLNVMGTTVSTQIRGLFWGKSNFLLSGLSNLSKTAACAGAALFSVYVLNWHSGSLIGSTQVMGTWGTIVAFLGYFQVKGLARPRLAYVKACLTAGWRAVPVNWLSFVQLRADQYLVNLLLGPAALGLYSVTVTLSGVLTMVPQMLAHVIFPMAARAKDPRVAARRTLKVALVTMVVIAIICIPIAYYAQSIITVLFGKAFSPATSTLQFLLPSIVFLGGMQLIQWHVAGLGYPKVQVIAMAAAVALNIACNLLLLPIIGVMGASISSSVSYGFWFLLLGGYLIRRANSEPDLPAEGLERKVVSNS